MMRFETRYVRVAELYAKPRADGTVDRIMETWLLNVESHDANELEQSIATIRQLPDTRMNVYIEADSSQKESVDALLLAFRAQSVVFFNSLSSTPAPIEFFRRQSGSLYFIGHLPIDNVIQIVNVLRAPKVEVYLPSALSRERVQALVDAPKSTSLLLVVLLISDLEGVEWRGLHNIAEIDFTTSSLAARRHEDAVLLATLKSPTHVRFRDPEYEARRAEILAKLQGAFAFAAARTSAARTDAAGKFRDSDGDNALMQRVLEYLFDL